MHRKTIISQNTCGVDSLKGRGVKKAAHSQSSHWMDCKSRPFQGIIIS